MLLSESDSEFESKRQSHWKRTFQLNLNVCRSVGIGITLGSAVFSDCWRDLPEFL